MSDIFVRWVLPDPNRERSVDPLGTSAFAERLADQLVPDFSGATSRARYLSLLCAAVRRAQHASSPVSAIHRIEADHAVREAELHRDEEPSGCPDIVGRQRATAELRRLEWTRPERPERLYKSTAFGRYRPLLRKLGFIVGNGSQRLSSDGERLAAAYPLHGSAERRCLTEITKREQSQLYGPLGLDGRGSPAEGSAQWRRRATYEYIARFAERPSGRTLLQQHARPRARAGRTAELLHTAYVWECLSVGLLAGMSELVQSGRLSAASRSLKDALAGKPRVPDLSEDLDAGDAGQDAVALLREAVRIHKVLPPSCKPHVDIAKQLVSARDPTAFLRSLVERHRASKGGDAWFRLDGDRVDKLAPGKNLDFRIGARSYRLDAYARFLQDLGRL